MMGTGEVNAKQWGPGKPVGKLHCHGMGLQQGQREKLTAQEAQGRIGDLRQDASSVG